MNTTMKNVMNNHLQKKQRGATLIISMLFLLMLTVIGLSSMNSSKLEQRMAHNYQLNGYVFQGAESAIDGAIGTATISFEKTVAGVTSTVKNPLYTDATNLFLTALNAGLGDTTTVSAFDANPSGTDLGTATISAQARIVYQGEMPCPPGTSFNTVRCARFDLTGTSSITGTGATATHRSGARYVMPGAS